MTHNSFTRSFVSWDLHLFRNFKDSELQDLCSLLNLLEGVHLIEDQDDTRWWVLDSSGIAKSF